MTNNVKYRDIGGELFFCVPQVLLDVLKEVLEHFPEKFDEMEIKSQISFSRHKNFFKHANQDHDNMIKALHLSQDTVQTSMLMGYDL